MRAVSISTMLRNAPLLLRIATAVGIGICLVNFTVWAMISVIGGHFQTPWFLWASLPAVVILAPSWYSADRRRRLLDE